MKQNEEQFDKKITKEKKRNKENLNKKVNRKETPNSAWIVLLAPLVRRKSKAFVLPRYAATINGVGKSNNISGHEEKLNRIFLSVNCGIMICCDIC